MSSKIAFQSFRQRSPLALLLCSFALLHCGVALEAPEGTDSGGRQASGGTENLDGTGGKPALDPQANSGGTTSNGFENSGLPDATGGESAAASGGGTAQNQEPGAATDCSTWSVCDDFESFSTGTFPDGYGHVVNYNYSGTPDPAEVGVTEEEAHSGSRALKVKAVSGLSGLIVDAPAGSFYVRAWYKFDAVPSQDNVILAAGEDGAANSELRLRARQGLWSMNEVPSDGLAPVDWEDGNCTSCATVPADWFCAELYVDAQAKTTTLWVDDNEVATISNGGPWHNTMSSFPAAIESVRFGGMPLGGGGATVFVDDIALRESGLGANPTAQEVEQSRIGCAN
ncbi:MAG: hypothetical protein MK135_02640 [Polyangiaceae bacterium]|nr:hypothetical protein [Polyangiaceae bacterium]